MVSFESRATSCRMLLQSSHWDFPVSKMYKFLIFQGIEFVTAVRLFNKYFKYSFRKRITISYHINTNDRKLFSVLLIFFCQSFNLIDRN